MTKFCSSLLLLTELLLTATAASSTNITTTTSSSPPSCGVYLAPSTIPGAGLGMFAGQDFQKGDQVTYGDIIIPIVELQWHNNFEDNFFWLWDEYTWSHSLQESMEFEVQGKDVSAASPGIGAALNCLSPLVNVEDSSAECDTAGLHRSQHPGAGAVTPYHGRASMAYRDVTQGDELFIDYGEGYFTSRESTYGKIPMTEHYSEADTLAYKYHVLHSHVLKYYSKNLQADVYQFLKNLETRTTNALPERHDDITQAYLQNGGTTRILHDQSRRSQEWLHEHGQCMDNIQPGPSSIEGAGRGAFATRRIPKGALVAPAPLIHIPNATRMIMYDALPYNDEGLLERNASAPVHQQLLLNYCFGHTRDSDVLLSPYGVVVNLINHDGKSPNTKIEWSKNMRHPEWLEQGWESMNQVYHSGLSFDFIALRDIAEGEEITIDYGADWQAAWDAHVENWKPKASNYKAAHEWNDNQDIPLPTMQEGGYADNLKLWVHGLYVELAGHATDSEYLRALIMDRFLNRDGEMRYTVQLFYAQDSDDVKDFTAIEYQQILWSIPRDALVFDDLPYTRDHSQFWSFRHAIGIPDAIFPEKWKRKPAVVLENKEEL